MLKIQYKLKLNIKSIYIIKSTQIENHTLLRSESHVIYLKDIYSPLLQIQPISLK